MPDPGEAVVEDDDKEEFSRQDQGGTTSAVRDKTEGYRWSDAEWAEWNKRWQWGSSWQSSWTRRTSGEKKDSEVGATGIPASAMPSTGADHSDPWQRPSMDLGHGGLLCQEHLMNQDGMTGGGATRTTTRVTTVTRPPGQDGATTGCGVEPLFDGMITPT